MFSPVAHDGIWCKFFPSWTTGLSDIARHKVPMLRGQPNLFRVQIRVPHATQNLGPVVQIHLPPAFAPASRDAVVGIDLVAKRMQPGFAQRPRRGALEVADPFLRQLRFARDQELALANDWSAPCVAGRAFLISATAYS